MMELCAASKQKFDDKKPIQTKFLSSLLAIGAEIGYQELEISRANLT